jgi:Holliday junction resolvase RusA-like endonuclease
MTKILIKPLSVNKVWQGKRYKTKEYKDYERLFLAMLPNKLKIPDGKLIAYYTFGVSNKNCDVDNFIKPMQDILSKKYEFNDNRIYRIIAEKVHVKKKDEYIEFKLDQLIG